MFKLNSNSKPYWVIRHGQFISYLGNACFTAATGLWLTFNQEHSLLVAAFSAMPILVTILLGPFIGTLIDMFEIKRLLAKSDLVLAFVSLTLAGIFLNFKSVSGLLIFFIFAANLIHCVFSIGYFTILEKLYMLASKDPDERMSLRRSTTTINQMIGLGAPSLGAFMVKLGGPPLALLVDSLTYFYASACAFFSVARDKENRPKSTVPVFAGEKFKEIANKVLTDTKGGLFFILDSTLLKKVILSFMAINLFLGSFPLILNFYIKDVLKMSMFSVPLLMIPSALFGFLLSGRISQKANGLKNIADPLQIGIAALFLSYVLLYAGSNFVLLIFATIIYATTGLIINMLVMNDIQSLVPEEIQGRVFSTIIILAQITTPVSSLLAATFIDYVPGGVKSAILLNTLGLLFVFLIRAKSLMNSQVFKDLPTGE